MIHLWWDPAAKAEAVGATAYFKAKGGTAGQRFAEDLRATLNGIVAFPRSCQANEDGARQKPLRKHPYVIVYRLDEETVEIIAVANTSRKPGYWRDRL